MFQQNECSEVVKLSIRKFLAGVAVLIVVGVGADLQAQCSRGGRVGGGQLAGRGAGPGSAMRGGGTMGSSGPQMAQMMQMMQMMQQAQQLQQMQRQVAMIQQVRLQQARQQQSLSGNQPVASLGVQVGGSTRPTMTRRERLRLLIQQRREEQAQRRPSRRELAIQRSSRSRQPVIVAAVETPVTHFDN